MARGERVLFHLPVLWMCCSLPSLTSGWACHHFCKICVFSPILESQRFKHSPQEEATLRIPGFAVQAEEMGQMLCYGLSLHYWKNNSTCSLVLLKWKNPPQEQNSKPNYGASWKQSCSDRALRKSTHYPKGIKPCTWKQHGARPAKGHCNSVSSGPSSPTAHMLLVSLPSLLFSVCPMSASPCSAMKLKALYR